jgi:pilus assembly protein Flp/PilA
MTNRRRVPRSDVIRGELGQGLVEYALILVLIAIVAIVALVFLGGNVSKYLSAIGTSI